jgi:hypothetical protein
MWVMIFVLTPGGENSVLSGEYSSVVKSVLQSHKSTQYKQGFNFSEAI